jgi:ABC-type amino acid transport substrate-binding protein
MSSSALTADAHDAAEEESSKSVVEGHDTSCHSIDHEILDGDNGIQNGSSRQIEPDGRSLHENPNTLVASYPSASTAQEESDQFDPDAIQRGPHHVDSRLVASNSSSDLHQSKQRASLASSDVGATHVDEVAPNLNLRFFRLSSRRTRLGTSLNSDSRSYSNHPSHHSTAASDRRPMSNIMLEGTGMTASVRRANSIRRSSLSGSVFSRSMNSNGDSPASSQNNRSRRLSSFFSRQSEGNQDSNVLINATLVESMEVAEAEPVGFFQKHGKMIGSISAILVVAFITLMSLTMKGVIAPGKTLMPTSVPSSMPSMAPSFDPRPTLAIVQDRGNLRCGLHVSRSPNTFRYLLCQAIAAVVLNDHDAVDIINVTAETRFVSLNDRTSDVLAGGETYTIEREVNEATTGASFTFSTPYYYDGMAFAGNQTFVTCAEEQKRYDECSHMNICVTGKTTDYEYVVSHFTVDFFVVTTSLEESIQFYFNGKCNVVASSRLDLLNQKSNHLDLLTSSFVIGDDTFNNDPLSYVTRPDDPDWSAIVDWVVQALFYGERLSVTKNATLCETDTNSLGNDWSDLNFLNAIYCVGNYDEIYNSSELAQYTRTAINTINNGTPMIYIIPYGNLDNANDETFYAMSDTFTRVKGRNKLNCGLLVPHGHDENVTAAKGLFGMGVSYCQTLASSMLDGNLYGVNYTTFHDAERSLAALNSKDVDVLFGVTADMARNFGNGVLSGVSFSTPYFYGNQTDK